MTFKKGESGNKYGRPKGAVKVLAEKARLNGVEMLEILIRLAKTAQKDGDRISAAKEVLDRGFGKALQSIELSGDEESPIHLKVIDAPPDETREQWENRIKKRNEIK